MSSLTEIIKKFPDKRILVIGDVILDHYIWGNVNRISPEAPVPVVEFLSEDFRLGGAANAAANIRSLGGQVDVVSIVGRDENGNKLRRMLEDIGAHVDGLLEDDGRPTIIKTRVIARNQQVVRIDREIKHEADGNLKQAMIWSIESTIPLVDAIIVSDYDKGVVSRDLLSFTLAHTKEQGKTVVIDPKMRNFWHYKGATVVTPNLKEASAAFGREITDDDSLLEAGYTLLERLELDALLITRGEQGMSLFEAANPDSLSFASQDVNIPVVTHIPATAREVFDVTGAGDTVVAVFTLALAAGASMLDAAKIANCAAGIVVGEVGTASVTQEELIRTLRKNCEHYKF
jgi:D-beta-D-heptose 7-phosphate kinase/D-beta-D-heptose 1-phosphate adenosyltransferase